MPHSVLLLIAVFCSPPWAFCPSHCEAMPTWTRSVWLVGMLRLRLPWRCGGIHLTLYASRAAASPAGPLGRHTGSTLWLILALSLSFSTATPEAAPKSTSGCTKMSETCWGGRWERNQNSNLLLFCYVWLVCRNWINKPAIIYPVGALWALKSTGKFQRQLPGTFTNADIPGRFLFFFLDIPPFSGEKCSLNDLQYQM